MYLILLLFRSDRITIVGELQKIKLHDIGLKKEIYYLWKNSVTSYHFYLKIKLTFKNTYELRPLRGKKYFVNSDFKNMYENVLIWNLVLNQLVYILSEFLNVTPVKCSLF